MNVSLICPTYFYTKGIECCAAAGPPLSGWQKHCLRYPPASCRFGHRKEASLRALFFWKQQVPVQIARNTCLEFAAAVIRLKPRLHSVKIPSTNIIILALFRNRQRRTAQNAGAAFAAVFLDLLILADTSFKGQACNYAAYAAC